MAIAGKFARVASMRSGLGDPLFSIGAPTPTAISLRRRASSSEPLLPSRPRMAVAGKFARVATMRYELGEPLVPGGALVPAASSLRSSSAALLRLPWHARSAASRTSVAVARAGWKSLFGTWGSGRGAEAKEEPAESLPADATDQGVLILGVDESRQVAKLVAIFLLMQKAHFLADTKLTDIKRKVLLTVLIGISLFVGLMAYKGKNWAIMIVAAFEKAEKIYKVIAAVATVFK